MKKGFVHRLPAGYCITKQRDDARTVVSDAREDGSDPDVTHHNESKTQSSNSQDHEMGQV